METTLHTQLKRYGMLCVGLLIMSFGIACSIKAELGTSPVSSLPFVLSQFTPLSVGIASVLLNSTLILLQILLLRRQYDPIQLIQLPVPWLSVFLPISASGSCRTSPVPPISLSGCCACAAFCWWESA